MRGATEVSQDGKGRETFAGASSSVSGIAFKAGASDIPSFGGRADSRLRGSSLTRDSLGPVVPESPASFGLTASHRGDGFEFDGAFGTLFAFCLTLTASFYSAGGRSLGS